MLNAKAEDPDLWSDQAEAQRVMRERTRLEHQLGAFSKLEREFNDHLELLEMAAAEGDQAIASETETALVASRRHVAKPDIESLLSVEAGAQDCLLDGQPRRGTGGTRAAHGSRGTDREDQARESRYAATSSRAINVRSHSSK